MAETTTDLLDAGTSADLAAIARLRDTTIPAMLKDIISGYVQQVKKMMEIN